MENKRKDFIRDVSLSFISPVFQYLSVFTVMIFIVKYLGAFGYGVRSQFNATLSFISIFACLNLGHSMSRFLAGEKKANYISTVFSSILLVVFLISLFIGTGIIIFKSPISDFLFGSKDYTLIVIFLAIILVLKNIGAENGALLKARRYIKTITLIDCGYFLSISIVVALTCVFTKNIFWVIASFVFLETIRLLVTSFFILNRGIKLTKPSFRSFFPLLKFGTPLLIASLGAWFVELSDRYLINYFGNISEVGIYSLNYGIACVLIISWVALTNILLADFSALYDQGRIKELEKRFGKILKYGIAFSLPGVFGLSFLAKPIIEVFSSKEFVSSYKVLIIVSIAIFFYGIFIHFATLLNVLKKVKVLNLMWVFMGVVNIIFNILLIPKFGIIGAAVSTLISFLLGLVIIILYSSFYFEINFKKNWLVKTVIACLIMGWIVSLIPVFSLPTLILAVLLGAVVYGTMLYLLKFYDETEILLFKRVFIKKI